MLLLHYIIIIAMLHLQASVDSSLLPELDWHHLWVHTRHHGGALHNEELLHDDVCVLRGGASPTLATKKKSPQTT